jgi:hypothetical protein
VDRKTLFWLAFICFIGNMNGIFTVPEVKKCFRGMPFVAGICVQLKSADCAEKFPGG